MTVNRMLRHGGRAVALTAVALGTVAATALPAAAEEQPTREQILADCASGEGQCTFNEPQLGEAFLGEARQVSDLLYNCSSSPASQSLSWADTVGSSHSVGGSITVGGGIEGIISASVTATYNYTWQSSHTETSTATVTVAPGEVGWISRAQVMQRITGTWQTHYEDRKWGHYYWFVPDVVTSPAPNGTDGKRSAVMVKSRKMTSEEKRACAASGSAEDKVFTRAG
ncbi:hypothetical protein N4P33_19085 [Streptomyces sp. 15-116A]|uniref:hypothetical protein n=1 Tax=Streptomyces sp. 15-116A TaxID=2259035 RepID=UPI0021B16CBA|nr:hypothetical protein [Streptomyces sp. 15-116A]MCT7354238.1 hypothetical protein [Streptomyces sp. 15-116A]